MNLTHEPESTHENGATSSVDWETFRRHVSDRGKVVYDVSWRNRCALELKLPWSFLLLNLFVRKLELFAMAVAVYLTLTGAWPFGIVGLLVWYFVLFPLKRKSVVTAITLHAVDDREYFNLANELGSFRLVQ